MKYQKQATCSQKISYLVLMKEKLSKPWTFNEENSMKTKKKK